MFIECSAKAGFNVKALFRKIAAALPGAEAGVGAGGRAAARAKAEDQLVDVKLTSQPVASSAGSSCAC
jgi:Ras-related protein Rab-6A